MAQIQIAICQGLTGIFLCSFLHYDPWNNVFKSVMKKRECKSTHLNFMGHFRLNDLTFSGYTYIPVFCFHMSRFKTKPTKWLCAQPRLRSARSSAQSDQSSLCAWRKLGPLATHWAHSEDSDQTGRMRRRMPRLIWVFAGCTATLLVLSCRDAIISMILFSGHCRQLKKINIKKWVNCSFYRSRFLKRYRLTICCPILMIQRLYGANLHTALYYDYAHFVQIVIISSFMKLKKN